MPNLCGVRVIYIMTYPSYKVDELHGWLGEGKKHLAAGQCSFGVCEVVAGCSMTACVAWLLDGKVCVLTDLSFN